MNAVRNLFLLFILLFSIICLNHEEIEVKEFEEKEIVSEFQLFNYKSKFSSFIIIIIKDMNYNINSYDEKILTIFNKATQESKDVFLNEISYYILDDTKNKVREKEYILKFRNYKGGSFIIYNSINSYPLINLENGFNLRYNFNREQKVIKLFFNTGTLQENILLDVYPKENIKIIKVSSSDSEEAIEIKGNSAELTKDYKYKIEYSYKGYQLEIFFKKREIINYNINDELKLNLNFELPNFLILNPSDYNKIIIYSYLYYYNFMFYNIEMAEIVSKKIESWNNIKFMNSTWMSTQNVYEISTTRLNKTYLLLKIILSNRFSLDNTGYFYKFKIFKEFSKSIEPLNSAEETLITEFFVNNIILITSNISNLRTFENNQSSSFIYQRESSYFSFIILPTQVFRL